MAKKTVRKTTTKKKVTPKKVAKKKAPTKKVAPKKVAKKKAVKKAPAKKVAKKKTTPKKVAKKKTTPKKVAKKKAPVKKVATKKATPKKAAKKKAVKKATAKKAVKKAPAKKVVAKKTPKKVIKKPSADSKIALKKASVQRADTSRKSGAVSFSLDEVQAVLEARKTSEPEKNTTAKKPKESKPQTVVKKKIIVDDVPSEKKVHAAASLADILGFNPAEKKKTVSEEAASIPRKWKKYYKLLLELRKHLQDELDLHTSDTLMHSNREDSGDLSNYGNHQADAGTDTFDRDFALSLVSNEQDALYEIEEAVRRMTDGTYGVCEQTGDPIKHERLEAVPFARFSLEGQKEYEKNNRRKSDRAVGELFSDNADAPKIVSDDDE